MADKPVIIEEYNPTWPMVFSRLAKVIGETVGELALSIEHVGSTSIPGLPAKPIIDLDIVIESRDQLPEVVARLETLGYFHEGDKGVPGREAFGRNSEDVPVDGSGTNWMVHHLYVCAKDSDQLEKHRAFRDYLRSHPETAKAYGELKRSLAQQYRNDRAAYTDAKTEFVTGVLTLASK